MPKRPRILCITTAGATGQDALRVRRLTEPMTHCDFTYFAIDKTDKGGSSGGCWQQLVSQPWDLVYMEGTGISGGLPLLRAAKMRGQRFVFSSGDPVSGFFRTVKGPVYGAVFGIYEKALFRSCAGFIGWTPYLVGRAIEMGAPRGVTVEGGVALNVFLPPTDAQKRAAKTRFGLNPDHIVCGVIGSLSWTPRQQYTYGLELVETLKRLTRTDVSLLIVGDGTGRPVLEGRLPPGLKDRAVFTGRVPEDQVAHALHAMDIGFVTQTLDGLGSYRLTTKLPEYLASALPIAMSPIPGYFDYVARAGWPLPPYHPASTEFSAACALWLDGLTREEIVAHAAHCRPIAESLFGYERIGAKFQLFIAEILGK